MNGHFKRGGYLPPVQPQHDCELPNPDACIEGSIWRCGGCGRQWFVFRSVTGEVLWLPHPPRAHIWWSDPKP